MSTPKTKAVLYLRSSKDRSDVSIDAQRRKLEALAAERGFAIVAEFTDAVESGKDDQRPGFQSMMTQLKAKSRPWNAVMLLDTSRLARNVYVAELFKHECKKRNIKVIYANLPEANPIVDLMMVQVFQAFDQMHSMMSREKGLAGMAENVKQGWRAGGRAPWGYQLVTVATGAIRDGAPVTKSRLEPSEDLQLVTRYLKARAAGRSRAPLMAEMGIERDSSSMVGTEWQALTYAGHTVWGVHNEQLQDGGYRDGAKRKPRSEWVIQRDTHQAAITDDEAEIILAKLETKKYTRARGGDYLLSGLLYTPNGRAWHGNAGYYRTGSKNIKLEYVEGPILQQLANEIENNDDFVKEVLKQARAMMRQTDDGSEIIALGQKVKELNQAIDRVTQALGMTSAIEPLLKRIEAMEEEKARYLRMQNDLEATRSIQTVINNLDESHVRSLLADMAEMPDALDRDALRDWIHSVVECIELDPATYSGQIKFRLGIGGDKVASPRSLQPIPTISISKPLKIDRPQRGRKAA